MNKFYEKLRNRMIHPVVLAFCAAAFLTFGTIDIFANHPVFVEGNCLGDGAAARTIVPPGTCGDYDGDGRIGTAEDNDAPFDRVFGTINAANAMVGANNNGVITIVASGIFPEVINITGNVTLQGAPGVEAIIDAVLQGEPGSGGRQSSPGIVVNSTTNNAVILRNLTSRNWTTGIRIMGSSRVSIDNCRLENNINYGIEVLDSARVSISKTKVRATGYRISPAGGFPFNSAPNPGIGILFSGASTGSIYATSVSSSFSTGISDVSSGNVCAFQVNIFDNNSNLQNIVPSATPCS